MKLSTLCTVCIFSHLEQLVYITYFKRSILILSAYISNKCVAPRVSGYWCRATTAVYLESLPLFFRGFKYNNGRHPGRTNGASISCPPGPAHNALIPLRGQKTICLFDVEKRSLDYIVYILINTDRDKNLAFSFKIDNSRLHF